MAGWLSASEASLLMQTAGAASNLPGEFVEVGSYCGKSTVAIGDAIRYTGKTLHAIDPHEGEVGGSLTMTMGSTLDNFRENIAGADLAGVVNEIRDYSFNVAWNGPIAFLFIDGLHDFENVSRDFRHFAGFLTPGALIAFHDYVMWPGVRRFVDGLISGGFSVYGSADNLIVLRAPSGGLADCTDDYSLSCLAGSLTSYFSQPGNLDAYMPSGNTLLYIGLGILGLILVTR
jgi:hypothetical protein